MKRCTKHSEQNRRDGRCQVCRMAARKRYNGRLQDAHRLVKTLERQGVSLSVANTPRVML